MAARHRSWKLDWGLRVLGLICCGIAYAAISHLCAMRPFCRTPAPLAYALAAIGFVGASAGGALTALGAQLFDPVRVSPRWGGVPPRR